MSYSAAIPFKSSADNQTVHGLPAIELEPENFPGFTGDGKIYLPARDITSNGAVIGVDNPLFVDRPRLGLTALEFVGAGTYTLVAPATGKSIAIASLDIISSIATTITLTEVTADDSQTTPLLVLPGVVGYSKEYQFLALLRTDRLLKIGFPEAATVNVTVQHQEV